MPDEEPAYVTRRECDLIESNVESKLEGIQAELKGFRVDAVGELKQLNGSNRDNTQFRLTHEALHKQQEDTVAEFRASLLVAAGALGALLAAINILVALFI